MEIDDLTDDELADLARLADGTLPPERRAEVEARVAASPELTEMVAAQGVTLQALRATTDIGAPASLRARVERRPADAPRGGSGASWSPSRPGSPRRRSSSPCCSPCPKSGPTVNDAAAIAQKRPSTGAPAGVPGTPQLLAVKVDDVPFPNYKAKFGWTPSGEREDRPSGRHATTVYYKKGNRDIAYTIVSGDALKVPASGGDHDARRRRVHDVQDRRPQRRHLEAARPHVRLVEPVGELGRAGRARRLARYWCDPVLGSRATRRSRTR